MLSAAIITKNEEERLPDCLRSIGFADDIVVIDCGSHDRTIAIAQEFGARVFRESWKGFALQKQSAVDHCLFDWVLIIDADERVPAETATMICRQLSQNDLLNVSAFSFRRKNFLHGRWIRHCGWYPDQITRLVHRKQGRFDIRLVHESWHTDGEIRALNADIEHISFRRYSEMIAKMENYSNLSAQELFKNHKKVHGLTPLTHGAWMFMRTYFLELGLLDGFDGFVISVLNAGGSFLKYAKLKELIETENHRYANLNQKDPDH